jgi:fused signal recognition particle receptor
MFDLFKRDNAVTGKSWSERLKDGLARSRDKLGGALESALRRPTTLDTETLEAIETALLTSDVGVAATAALIEDLARDGSARAGRGTRRRC